MPISLVFLGWNRPLCETVPTWLLRSAERGTLDMRGTVVGVPTRQASWRLRAALPLMAHTRFDAALLGPVIMTASGLIEPPPSPGRASALQALLAWSAVLRETPPDARQAFLGDQRPGTDAWALSIARRLIGLRRELADGMLTINDVAGGGPFEETERWQAMADLERRYLDRLARWGLRDPISDQLTHARDGCRMPDVERVVLAAVPDPPRLLMTLLEAWSGQGVDVTVLIAAPPERAADFDGWGRPVPETWENRPITLDDRDIRLAADPDDQAQRIAAMIAAAKQRSPSPPPSQHPALAIGVPDRETVAPLQRELAAIGLPAFDPRNRPLSETPLYGLVQTLLTWRERPGYAETAAVLRHPHILDALPDATQVLVALDTVQSRHLPVTLADLMAAAEREAAAPSGGAGSPAGDRPAATDRPLVDALQWLQRCRRELLHADLATGLRNVLRIVYEQRQLLEQRADDNLFRQAAEALDGVLRELADAETAGQAGTDVAAILAARLQGVMLKPDRGHEPLDLEGWLELAWNPAPILLVAGMNEGMVPDSQVGDLFLPDSLRRKLALRDDRLRLARDAYLLTMLGAQRSAGSDESSARMIIWVGKRSGAGDPLRPSRLLFRCPDDHLVSRAQRLFRDPPPSTGAAPHAISFKLDPALVPAGEIRRNPPSRLSPTAFKAYLACPFRYYLERLLGMQALDDRAREPDARAFGDLCHAVLDAMGRDPQRIWACGDDRALGDWLEMQLRRMAVEWYGESAWLGVTLAVDAAAGRLRAFAHQQTAWHQQGWDLIETEATRHQTQWGGVTIAGRIDRIDRHRESGAVCVLDYKTTDKATPPGQTHLGPVGDPDYLPEAIVPAELTAQTGRRRGKASGKRWIDLQLPLYREMVRAAYGPDVAMGYVHLPAALGETAFTLWNDYPVALQQAALECARAMADRIRAGHVWPPAPKTPAFDTVGDLVLDNPMNTFNPPPIPWSRS